MPCSCKLISISVTQPAACTPGSETIKTLLAPKTLAKWPTRCRQPAPKTISGETNLRSSLTDRLINTLLIIIAKLGRSISNICSDPIYSICRRLSLDLKAYQYSRTLNTIQEYKPAYLTDKKSPVLKSFFIET